MSCIVVVPIYQERLNNFELFSLRYSLIRLVGRKVLFIGPHRLPLDFYQKHFPSIGFVPFDDAYFASIAGYNRLLLSEKFYQFFSEFEFLLILQTDAIILSDDLDFWCDQPFDYVGAPWPDRYELLVNLGAFSGDLGKKVSVSVGNGGLSLRRVHKMIALLHEFKDALQYFQVSGSSEDLFFSVMAALSHDCVVPNEITASRFSMELKPSYYFAVNGGKIPMGGHAWWKYEPQFWYDFIG